MKILVLGANGFLGKRIVNFLTQKEENFYAATRQDGDLRNFYQFQKIVSTHKPDVILHAAAFVGGIHFGIKHQGELYYNNSLINTYLFEIAKQHGVKRIINPIPNCSYPRDVSGSFEESQWWDGELDSSVMVYGFVRKASWVQSYAYYKQYGLETINLIVPNMYGPEDHFEPERSHALGGLINRIYEAKQKQINEVAIWGSGKPVREWLYIDNCAEAMYRSISIPYTSDPINIGVGYGISITELAEIIKTELGYNGNFTFDTSKIDGAPYKVMNVEKCKNALGWIPPTDLKEGIKWTIQWYLENIK